MREIVIAVCDDCLEAAQTLEKIIRDTLENCEQKYEIRFITKPFSVSEVEEALGAVLMEQPGSEELEVHFKRNIYKIHQREFCFLKAVNGEVECYAKHQSFRREGSLNRLEQILDKRLFFRVSKQYIVNFAHIDEYDAGVIRIGREYVTVSRRKRKEFEKKYVEYDLKYGVDDKGKVTVKQVK